MKRLLTLLLVFTLVLTACGGNKSGSGDKSSKLSQSKSLNLNLSGEPYTLDPAFASDTTSWWVIDSIYSGLYRKGENGKPELDAAESVRISDDKKTYTFKLKDGLKWSNGDALTAKDFEYSWKRVLDPKTAAYSPSALYFIEGAEAYNTNKGKVEDVKIKAVDDKTLQVGLKNPIDFFPKIITGAAYYPVNKNVVEKNKKWSAEASTLVTNGPFVVEEWKHNDHINLKKNDKSHLADKVKLPSVHFKMVADTNTEYQLYKNGELDLLPGVGADVLKQVKGSKELKSYENFSVGTYSFNINEKPVNNKKIRQALSYAIDRKSFVENVLKGGQKPAYGYVSPGAKDSTGKDYTEYTKQYYKFDAKKAKALLREGLKEEGLDKLPKITLKTNGEGINKKSAEVVQEMLKQNLDVDIAIETQEWKTYIDTFKQKDFQIARMGWNGDFLDPYPMLALYESKSSSNFTNWKNKKYDELLEASLKEQDDKKRYQLLAEAEAILMDELPIIPINFGYTNSLIKSNVKGIKTDALSRPEFVFAEKVVK
ncbi:peptide ABC transporter substrate-binding protein [Macrococcus capreoli]|uniref:peptide ABC transporter substrate-binding protein n=1 Tax=Macrococcus capreoli TaxID=2982690 RepID=UPI003EE66C82